MAKKLKTHITFQRSFLLKEDTYYDSWWIQKFNNKLMLQGKKYIIDKYIEMAFIHLKFKLKKIPWGLFAEQVHKFRPVIGYVVKRQGRQYNPVPVPIPYRRQYILAITSIVKYTKSMVNRNFDDRLIESLEDIFESKRNFITKTMIEDVHYLTEARLFSHLRWK